MGADHGAFGRIAGGERVEVAAEDGLACDSVGEGVRAHGVEERLHAVHPHLVVIVLDGREGERRPPRVRRASGNVLQPEHDARPTPPFPEGRERPQQFALGTSRTLVDDDQIGIEAERRRAKDRAAHALDLGICESGDAAVLPVAAGSSEPRQRDVVDAGRKVERMESR